MQRFFSLIQPIVIFRMTIILTGASFFGLIYLFQAPYLAPSDTIITVTQGESFRAISHDFKDRHIIHSTLLFRLVVFIIGGERNIVAGDYYVSEPLSLIELASRLDEGSLHMSAIKVTIPEGANNRQIADLIKAKIPRFDTEAFLTQAETKEGYLFPETYFFLPRVQPAEVIKTMGETFDEQIASSTSAIEHSGHSLEEIITIASILEREAKTVKDWQIISGILWKRLTAGMALQVDATLNYYTGKTSAEITSADLKHDSPYNTYTNKGLPPTPIANPGIQTIQAALNPVTTAYWYYLSDAQDVIHYARTYDEHLRNRTVYLNK